jgi:hypothetical protein
MRLRVVMGTLGLILALVWAMAFLYQRNNVDFLMAMFWADAPTAVRVSSLWSALQIWITALLVLPVAATSIGTMFGARRMVRVLRIGVATSAVLSVGVLVIYTGMAVPRVAGGGPVVPANPRIYYELLVALGTLGLQIVLLVLFWRFGNRTGGALRTAEETDGGPKSDEPLQPSSRDSQRAALPPRPFVPGDASSRLPGIIQ